MHNYKNVQVSQQNAQELISLILFNRLIVKIKLQTDILLYYFPILQANTMSVNNHT